MKVIKFVLPAMLIVFSASAESMDPNCRIYSPVPDQGSVASDGVWVPAAAPASSQN